MRQVACPKCGCLTTCVEDDACDECGASTATSEKVPHAACTRCTEAALHRRPGFHGKLGVDVGEVATGGDFIPMTSLFLS